MNIFTTTISCIRVEKSCDLKREFEPFFYMVQSTDKLPEGINVTQK